MRSSVGGRDGSERRPVRAFLTDLIIRVQCLFPASIFGDYVVVAAVGSLPVRVCSCPMG
jgi:hypothetical protein